MELDKLTINSPDSLKKWLTDKPVDWAQVIAVRAALRVFPLVFQVVDLPDTRLRAELKHRLLLESFRAAFISWAANKYSDSDLGAYAENAASAAARGAYSDIAAKSVSAADAAASAYAAARSAATAKKSTSVIARTAASAAARASSAAEAAATRGFYGSAERASYAAVSAMWLEVLRDCEWLNAGNEVRELIARPIWTEDVQNDDWSLSNAPAWALKSMENYGGGKAGPWSLIIDWYRALLPFDMSADPKSLFGENKDIAIAIQPDTFWMLTKQRSAEDVLRGIKNIEDIPLRRAAEQDPKTISEFIEGYLKGRREPSTVADIRAAFKKADFAIKDKSMLWALSTLTTSGTLVRLAKGVYIHRVWQEKQPHWDFFLSYNENDRATAERISDFLEDSGYAVFSQFNDMTAGKSFVGEMNRGLDGMGRLISIYSDDYFASGPCMSEWEAAYLFDPSGDKGKIVPFMVRTCSPPALARRLVWTSLLGLSSKQEKRAVLNAIKEGDTPRDRVLQRRAWTQASSPDVALDSTGERLDAVPNKEFDDPYVDVDLADLPELLRSLIHTVMEALKEKNCSSGFVAALNAYKGELDARGASCIVSVLRGQMDFVEAELDDPESNHWLSGAGLKKTFENIRNAHVKLLAHYPLDQDRERLLRVIQLDRPKLEPDASRELREKIVHATEVAHDEDIVTDSYRTVVESRHRVTRDILELRTPEPLDDGDVDHRMNEEERARRLDDAKKRALAQQAGFADKSLDTLNKMAKLADSPSAQRLAKALQDLADWFW